MTETTTTRTPRWRLVVFWLLLLILLVLHLGERPEQLGFVVTAFGGYPEGAGATHEIHMFAQGVFAWVLVAAVLVQLRRPARQVGAAWVYGVASVLAFTMVLAMVDLPADVVGVVAAAIVIAALAFVVHPSSLRAKFSSVARPSALLFVLVAVAAVPLVVYAAGQLNIHAASGPHDEHYAFGHWVIMAVYALLAPVLAAVAAWKVSGWRFVVWVSALMVAALGVASLGIDAASQLSTLWAVLAIVWAIGFIAAGEREARAEVATETASHAART